MKPQVLTEQLKNFGTVKFEAKNKVVIIYSTGGEEN